MQKFQLRNPFIFEAMQWFDTDECREKFAKWFQEVGADFSTLGSVAILNNGRADLGDWIALHADGEFYPHHHDWFDKHYMPVEEEATSTSNLVKHAETELRLAGLFDANSDYEGMLGQSVLALVRCFSAQGHSGFSAQMTLNVFNRVARFKTLTEITSDPSEWRNISDMTPGESPAVWQNLRQSSCFSNDGGKTYYDIDDNDGRAMRTAADPT